MALPDALVKVGHLATQQLGLLGGFGKRDSRGYLCISEEHGLAVHESCLRAGKVDFIDLYDGLVEIGVGRVYVERDLLLHCGWCFCLVLQGSRTGHRAKGVAAPKGPATPSPRRRTQRGQLPAYRPVVPATA